MRSLSAGTPRQAKIAVNTRKSSRRGVRSDRGGRGKAKKSVPPPPPTPPGLPRAPPGPHTLSRPPVMVPAAKRACRVQKGGQKGNSCEQPGSIKRNSDLQSDALPTTPCPHVQTRRSNSCLLIPCTDPFSAASPARRPPPGLQPRSYKMTSQSPRPPPMNPTPPMQ